MRSIRQYGLAAAVSAVLVATGSGAAADPGEATHVDGLIAVRGASGITVSGSATFVDTAVLVGESPVGNSLGASLGAPLGDDLTTVTIARPDPFKNTLTFTLGVANQPPTLNGTPEFMTYEWGFSVATGNAQPRTFQLNAQRSGQVAKPGTDPFFVLYSCVLDPSTNVSDCSKVADLTGRMADGVVEWHVPFSHIGAQKGSVIAQSGGIQVLASVSGGVWGGIRFDQAAMDTDYVIPGPTVQIGIAPAGTPADQIDLTGTATVQSTGAFTGTLPTPSTPGSYVVVAQACNGAGNCGLATTNVTV